TGRTRQRSRSASPRSTNAPHGSTSSTAAGSGWEPRPTPGATATTPPGARCSRATARRSRAPDPRRHNGLVEPVDQVQLLRQLAPRVRGALVRSYGRFDACEDAVQEALLAAALRWPQDGLPDNPRGWLIAVASRRLIDEFRSDEARRARE